MDGVWLRKYSYAKKQEGTYYIERLLFAACDHTPLFNYIFLLFSYEKLKELIALCQKLCFLKSALVA